MDAQGIEHILRELGSEKIRTKNNTVHATCPFAPYAHQKGKDSHPSFGVEINGAGTSKWGCFACANGANQTYSLIYRFRDYTGTFRQDLIDYIKEREGESLSYKLSKMEWQSSKRVENPKYVSSRVPDYEPKFDIKEYHEVLSYLPTYAMERGITPQLALRWKLGWLRAGMQLADGYIANYDRLFFTIIDHEQRMVGWSGRLIQSFPDDYSYTPPKYHHAPEIKKEKYLYGENLIDKSLRIGFVVESFMDVLNLAGFGWKNILAIMGANASFTQLTKLAKWFDHVYVLRHADKAGFEMAERLDSQLKTIGVNCTIVEPLSGRKDSGEWTKQEADSVLQNLGIDYGFGAQVKEEGREGKGKTETHEDECREGEAGEPTNL